MQRGDETWCYVSHNGQVQKRPIEVGKTNDKFVEICDGLVAGDEVVLNPSAILEDAPAQEQEIASDKERIDEGSLD